MDLKEFVKLAVVTEAPAAGVAERLRILPEAQDNFLEHSEKVIKNLQILDLWKKAIFYGKKVAVPMEKSLWQKFVGLFKKEKPRFIFDKSMVRLLHGTMGIATESCELYEALMKKIKGEEVDLVNIKEEIGDVLWYVAILCDELKVDIEPIMEKVIAKLELRYKGKFDEYRANIRNLEEERKLLEGSNDKTV